MLLDANKVPGWILYVKYESSAPVLYATGPDYLQSATATPDLVTRVH